MDERPEISSFRRHVAFFHRRPAGKLAAAPVRMLSSVMKRTYCRVFGKSMVTRVKTFWGRPMEVEFPEPGSIALMRYGFIEERLTSLMLKLLRPGMTFFDVGAHYGYFSLLASKLAGPGGQVHAFEPSPHTFATLSRNAAGCENIRLNQLALFSGAGELTFHDFGVEFSEFNSLTTGRIDDQTRQRRGLAPREIKVRTDTMDHYVEETGISPDLIKIDAEGAEADILRGTKQVLERVRPMLTVEVGADPSDQQGASAESIRLLQELGYAPHEWADGQIRRHAIRASYIYDNLLFLHPQGAQP